ncbi:sterol carrier protein domain-containing protein [Paenibacillus sp. N3.4]|uniref:sterol carrier protein domain-containing protein n=1 Tax=Paenibacillus sp. N3.4 TaxID=2603222 RepID=UPI0021C311A0|nr:sterol carrier protein domain-containing protein [Paenibacillus sp. N3.4]
MHVSDSHAEWNNGIYRLAFSEGGIAAQVTKLTDDNKPSDDKILHCSIQSLTALLMGYQTPSFMARIERLNGHSSLVKQLEASIPKRVTYLADFF